MIETQGLNSYADLDEFAPISNSTVKRYMVEIKTSSREGKIKPVSRVEPFLNIRNAISKAAGLTALSRLCPLENIHSEDEVGVCLFGWHGKSRRPKLGSTREADEFLSKNNVSLSTTEDPDKQRAVHIGATLQAHSGELTCFYLRIVDNLFPQEFKSKEPTVSKPRIWLLNPSINFYVVTCHPTVTDTTVMEYIGKYITHPAIFNKQDTIIDRELSANTSSLKCNSLNSNSDHEEMEVAVEVEEEQEDNDNDEESTRRQSFEGNIFIIIMASYKIYINLV
jgi:hypothetical protein